MNKKIVRNSFRQASTVGTQSEVDNGCVGKVCYREPGWIFKVAIAGRKIFREAIHFSRTQLIENWLFVQRADNQYVVVGNSTFVIKYISPCIFSTHSE